MCNEVERGAGIQQIYDIIVMKYNIIESCYRIGLILIFVIILSNSVVSIVCAKNKEGVHYLFNSKSNLRTLVN